MKKILYMKPFALLLIFLLMITMPQIVSASIHIHGNNSSAKPSPRLVSGLKLASDAQVVDGGEIITFTASFMDTQATPEPVTITATDGGIINAEIESDIIFHTNGIKKDINDLETSEDRDILKFMTAELAVKKASTIVFQVQAPLSAESFDVLIQIGTGLGTRKQTINVIPGLTIEAPETVNDEDPIYITGNARYKGKQPPKPSYIFVEIININTGKPMDEIQYQAEIINNHYSFGPLTLPTDYENGAYEINVYMMHDDIILLGTASKIVNYEKTKTLITLNVDSGNEITASKPFYITGSARYLGKQPPQPSYVFLEIINKETELPIDEIQFVSNVIDEKYSIGPIIVPESYNEGAYYINVYLIHDDLTLLCFADKEVVLKR